MTLSSPTLVQRKTKETDIRVELNLYGTRQVNAQTGIGMLDHLIHALAFHAGWDLDLQCQGDLEIDDHHSAEDCALTLGEAFRLATGDRRGLTRFGYAYAPLDEALARTVVDLSGRPWPEVRLGLEREFLGALATENVEHFLTSFALASGCALHVEVLYGKNDHHRAEAAFKSAALAFKQACSESSSDIASTKGTLGGAVTAGEES